MYQACIFAIFDTHVSSVHLDLSLNETVIGKIQTDWRSEFVNPHVKKALLKYNIMLYHSHSPIKTALAERVIRTIQLLVW